MREGETRGLPCLRLASYGKRFSSLVLIQDGVRHEFLGHPFRSFARNMFTCSWRLVMQKCVLACCRLCFALAWQVQGIAVSSA